MIAIVTVIIAIIVTPQEAHAWTPGTHIFLGDAILRSLALLSKPVAELLMAFPYDFLYGSIAADTSIAKKYAATGRHCHSWNVGFEIYDKAPDERLKSFGLGYLAHLAADSVAHNYYVPKQLAVTSTTAAIGHSYWESRIDNHIRGDFTRRAREIIMLDHVREDDHLDRILSPTIFTTPTNRRIFRGMVYVADTDSWQRVFQMVADRSRWDLPQPEVTSYLARSYSFIMDLLNNMDSSDPFKLDPSGDEALRIAKQLRRTALRKGGSDQVFSDADQMFGMPSSEPKYALPQASQDSLQVPEVLSVDLPDPLIREPVE